MGDLSQLLREAREHKGASLEEVEEATHIRQKFLQALEEGDFVALPAETYVKGFLRTYAMYLELDPEELMALYEGQEDEGKTALPQPGFFQPMDISMAAPSWLTPDMVIGALLIVVLVAFGCWATWRYLPPTIKTQLLFWQAAATATPSPTATVSAVLPSATPTATPTTMPTASPTEIPTTMPTATPIHTRRFMRIQPSKPRNWVFFSTVVQYSVMIAMGDIPNGSVTAAIHFVSRSRIRVCARM